MGDTVFGVSATGGMAEQCLMYEAAAYKLPMGLDPHIAAGFELNYGTSWHGVVDLANIRAGETLLVLGASGGVGMAAIDIGKAVGATVVACASTPAKLEACRAQGADLLVDYSGDFKAALKEAGVYGDVDVVYDPVGGALAEMALRSLGWGGRFVVVGFASGGAVPNDAIPRIPLNQVLLNERQVLGLFWGAWKTRDKNEKNRKNMAKMIQLLQDRKLSPTVSKVFSLESANGQKHAC